MTPLDRKTAAPLLGNTVESVFTPEEISARHHQISAILTAEHIEKDIDIPKLLEEQKQLKRMEILRKIKLILILMEDTSTPQELVISLKKDLEDWRDSLAILEGRVRVQDNASGMTNPINHNINTKSVSGDLRPITSAGLLGK